MKPIHAPMPDDGGLWFNYAFEITDARIVGEPARLRIEAKADAGAAIAGLGIEFVRDEWERDQVYADIWFDHGIGALFSIGAESDALACLLSREIGDGRHGRFVNLIVADVAMINSRPNAMLTERCESKFFLGEPDEGEAQVFVNFDLPSGIVELREKDLDDRQNLLSHLVVH